MFGAVRNCVEIPCRRSMCAVATVAAHIAALHWAVESRRISIFRIVYCLLECVHIHLQRPAFAWSFGWRIS